MPLQELSDEDRDLFRRLEQKLWCMKGVGDGSYWKDKTGAKLTESEYSQVKVSILRSELIRSITNISFGFSIGLVIRAHSIYPCTPPEYLLTIGAGALPGRFESVQGEWQNAWKEFSELAKTARNQEMLTYYGFELPKNRESYLY